MGRNSSQSERRYACGPGFLDDEMPNINDEESEEEEEESTNTESEANITSHIATINQLANTSSEVVFFRTMRSLNAK